MEHRRLGSTSISVSELGINLDPSLSDSELRGVVAAALDEGCNFFAIEGVEQTTATVIGKTLESLGVLHSSVVSLTVKARLDSPNAEFVDGVEGAIRALGRDSVDILSIDGEGSGLFALPNLCDVMHSLVGRQLTQLLGIVSASNATLLRIPALPEIRVLQMPYNLLSLVNPRTSPDAFRDRVLASGVPFFAREPLAGGFLTSSLGVESSARGLSAELGRRKAVLAAALTDLCPPGVTLAQVALRFVLDERMVTSTVVGVRSPEEVTENFAALRLPSFESIVIRRSEESREYA